MAYKSNKDAVLSTYRNSVQTAVSEGLDTIQQSVKKETPVKTGDLRRGTETEQPRFDEGIVFNKVHYGPYVEFGTYKQYANPFFRRGIINAIPQLIRIFARSFKL